MKKTIYLLMLVLALGFASCNQSKSPEQSANTQKPITTDCELAVFDDGQLSFYDVKNHEFITLEQETDSVVNGVFANDGKFYYSVLKGDKVLLKYIDLNEGGANPVVMGDWGVDPSHCITETYGEFASLEYYPWKNCLGLGHEFSWEGYGFYETRLFDLKTGEARDLNWDVESLWDGDDDGDGDDIYEGDFETKDDQVYYFNDGGWVCLSDQMNVKQYASDPDYTIDLYYNCFEMNQNGDMVRFAAPIEAGDFEHGPWCVASLDGKFQMVLEGTDFCTDAARWLSDGSLVFNSTEPRPESDPDYNADWNYTKPCIKVMNPNHEITVLSHAGMFIAK